MKNDCLLVNPVSASIRLVQRAGGWMKHWMQDLIGAGLAIGVGLWVLNSSPLALPLANWSYDLPHRLQPDLPLSDVAIVSTDAVSTNGPQSSSTAYPELHANLLNRLISKGARMVVFTEVFSERPYNAEGERNFVQALRRARGRVILAGRSDGSGTKGTALTPRPEFASETAWGFLAIPDDANGIVRRLDAKEGVHPTLAVRVTELLGRSTNSSVSRWMHYYSAKPRLPYFEAADVLAGTGVGDSLKGKIVLVGRESEQLPTPFTLWTGSRATRPEIEATAILNLTRREWLWRLPPLGEAGVLVITGTFLGFAFMGLRRTTAVLLAVGAIVLSGTVACLLLIYVRLWFPWLIVALLQAPVAFVWALVCDLADRPGIQRSPAGPVLNRTQNEIVAAGKEASSVNAPAPKVPDHTLVKCIGRGSYGEVWLARDVFGRHQAVKIVKAQNFPDPAPYEREFKGIERFAPISRSHPGLVHVLHVGRSDADGYFFYIMELADDASGKLASGERRGPRSPHERQQFGTKATATETRFDSETYAPRTLAGELTKRGHLSVRESIEMGLQLSSALQHLHERKLVHRDIKPSNIIFVEGLPKFADIGLVAPFGFSGERMTRLGTDGYLAPEGPGAPTADIYSLGKVLYEISMGRDRWQFPELPTTIGTRPDQEELRQLHQIILTACETDLADRFKSAAEMNSALKNLLGSSA